jgi:elongation factor P--(R)-beta-lysine ligase
LQVGPFDNVAIDQSQSTDSRTREQFGNDRPQRAATHNGNIGRRQPVLAIAADFGILDLPCVSVAAVIAHSPSFFTTWPNARETRILFSTPPLSPLRQRIARRADLVRRVRSFFDAAGFLEVQPNCLEPECVIDPYIDPVSVGRDQHQLAHLDDQRLYLQTSPEAAMKRMLVEGSGSIYSLGPVFRAGEWGNHHRIEFTMLEWYEVEAGKWDGIQTLQRFSSSILGGTCAAIAYVEAFKMHAGIDPIEASLDDLIAKIDDRSLTDSMGADRDGLLDIILSDHVQPKLIDPVVVYDYPVSQAALANVSSDDPRCAGRFEWFASGVELGNGYDELRDADVLLQRSALANEKRRLAGRTTLPHPQSLISAMRRGLPKSSGVAVGFDRLLMVHERCSDLASISIHSP